jgi:ribonuclease HII
MVFLKSCLNSNELEAGCDEAGRGCIAGPVFAAAVILPHDFHHPDLNDSKQLSDKKRRVLRSIIESESISWSVSFLDHSVVDSINVLNASIKAMQDAVLTLKIRPSSLLIDGNRFKPFEIPYTCVVKGDSIYKSIAAASILAKTYRDDYMELLHADYPAYHWNENKGYPTKKHCDAIIENGYSEYHRRTFVVKSLVQTSLKF